MVIEPFNCRRGFPYRLASNFMLGALFIHGYSLLAVTSDGRRETSNVLNMQNKPNLPNTKMNVSPCFTMNYEQITMNDVIKNKPNQSQSCPP